MKIIYIIFSLLKTEQMEKAGQLVPDGSNDGRTTYTLVNQNETIEHVYLEEVIQYLQTGSFVYDEDLTLFNIHYNPVKLNLPKINKNETTTN